MKLIRISVGIVLAFVMVVGRTNAQPAPEPLQKLANELINNLRSVKKLRIAVLEFKSDAKIKIASFVQERLTTYLANSNKFEVIERSLLQKIIKEKELELTGLLASDSPQVGTILGVEAVVSGVISSVNEKEAEINARIIDSKSGAILAATFVRVVTSNINDANRDLPVLLGKPLVQIAILLDTSSSMDGLINQTRTMLWKVINDLAGSEKGNEKPALQVALYEYGNSKLSESDGFVRQLSAFSADLDTISEKLFSLVTDGGLEYAGYVIDKAVKELNWAPQDDVYKAIFIAGNEPFTQGPVPFADAIGLAIKKGIIVNTIFCGNRQQGIATKWQAGAELAGGDFMTIDQGRTVVAVVTPHDDRIAQLGRELNQTYVPYGSEGSVAIDRQRREDENAKKNKSSGAEADRMVYKSQEQYSYGTTWDLVTLIMQGKTKISDIKKEQLPAQLQKMTNVELEKYINQQIETRKKIQAEIQKLNASRQTYIAEQNKKGGGSDNTIDAVMQKSIRKQAESKKFKFKN